MLDQVTHVENKLAELERVTLDDLSQVAQDARSVLDQVHRIMQHPNPAKTPPTFQSPYIAELCKIDKGHIRHLAEKHKLPYGTKIPGSKAHEYTLEEVIQWVNTLGNYPKRPEGQQGLAIAVVNYKGGVAKTSTAVALAQGLSLRGLKVLLIDQDGQGTATQMFGINPEEHVDYEHTIMPYIEEDQPDLRYAVQPTYWHNLSLIPAASVILAAEFSLPAKAAKKVDFWNFIKRGIEPLRQEFDVIIFDTSPSLSHLTMNTMLAADGLVMPCPPDALDFASSVQFWGLFDDLLRAFRKHDPNLAAKTYAFMTVVMTKVQPSEGHRLVKPWLKQAYGRHINVLEIPESAAARMAAAQLKTIYDLGKAEGTVEAYRRFKEPMDKFCDDILEKIALAWRA
ncbi:ParA family protein [Noviherbaspirillum galbum]|uniref:AAA family ATPase n=1 Tax=Noviherbaspirillum galbum TaxID=2709383 RepID=A0A6B3SHH8_9BURK|nr:AAA family ATPase [Noviherbaspirillum galbum]NEX60128.1 AAA family ATPase [Noviherbaspirillum galbum]